ncbi:MAG: c-type cytochrome domain-containing protein, partial [Pirellulaceae bacterium]|nr:c-type cytochrome domain-containing protein [Pirellulaceae bacterium]
MRISITRKAASFAVVLLVVAGVLRQANAEDPKPIPIADVKVDGMVDFEKQILPILRRKCLACHNSAEAESDLVLETPAAILKGGSLGPSAVAGKGAESLIVKVSARLEEPFMPPADNDVEAKDMTSEELGLLKLWVDQGATGEVTGGKVVNWQPLPPGVNPIYAVAISPDGQFAAAGRANQIFVYHVPSKREVGRLTDPALLEKAGNLPGLAHLDLVQSLAFDPSGARLASGGYRNAKLWRRAENVRKLELKGLETAARSAVTSADGKLVAVGEENGKIRIFDLSNGNLTKTLEGHTAAVRGLAFSADGAKLFSGSAD